MCGLGLLPGDEDMILSAYSTKGGVGKTTIAQNVAEGLGFPLVDFDPQRDAQRWHGLGRSKVVCSEVSEEMVLEFLQDHVNSENMVVCDLPPGIQGLPVAALSELCIIPTRPGDADLVALGRALQLLGQAKKSGNPDLKIAVVLTQARVASSRTNTVDQALREMARQEGFTYLGVLHHRVAVEAAGGRGRNLFHCGDGAAAHEFRQILSGIQGLLNS